MRRHLLALTLLAACATPPPLRQPRPPIAEATPGAAAIGSDTASETGAALLSATVAIDLASVLGLAGARPNAIRLAEERLHEADAQVDLSLAALLPSLTVGGNFSRHDGVIQDVSGPFIDTTRQAFFLGGTGEVVLDVGGSIYAFLSQRQRRSATSAELEATIQERILASVTAYFDLAGAEAGVEIARDALEHAQGFLAVAASRERNMIGLPLDRIRAEADVARARQELIAADERARVASIRLATILRLDATVTLHVPERAVRRITFIAPETPVEQLVASALEAHPLLQAADRRVAAADLDEDASRIGPFVPTVRAGVGGLNGGLGYNGPELSHLEGREDYYVALELRLTGLGFGEVARARAASARLRAERVRADDVRETVIQDVLEAREAVRSRNAAIDAALEELRAADEARRIARKRLEQGTGIAIDVLAAEEERTRAATHVIDAIVGYNVAQYRLVERLGDRPGY